MTYLKRLLYLLSISILIILASFACLLYLGLIPIGMIVAFILTEDFTMFFLPLEKLIDYVSFICNKLESIFLE